MAKGPDVAGALAAMRQAPARGRGRKSAVYVWLSTRYDALAAAFEKEPPSWAALARYLGEGGIKGSDGLPPTAAAVRSAWLRVSEAAKRRRARNAARDEAEPAEMPEPPEKDDPEPDDAGPATPRNFDFLREKR